MKNQLFILLLATPLLFNCSGRGGESDEEVSNEVIINFLNDVSSLEYVEGVSPIIELMDEAHRYASETLNLTKESMPDVLEEAANHKHFVIIVEDHTAVKITSLDDCKQSGAWGVCMPHGSGYIKKGELVEKKDYINNIIGVPDNQMRTAFFFD